MGEGFKQPEAAVESLRDLLVQREKLIETQLELQAGLKERVAPILAEFKARQIDAAEFSRRVKESEAPSEALINEIPEVERRIRLQYTKELYEQNPPDEKRAMVDALDLPNTLNVEGYNDISGGGSNTSGVFEIPDTNLVAIEKSIGTFQHVVGLPPKMQQLSDSTRIPRILSVFEKGGKTYQVMEKAEGTQLDKMSPEEIAEIPQEAYDALARDIASLNSLRLRVDPSKSSNLFYDKEKGFVLIDLAMTDPFRDVEPSQVDPYIVKCLLLGAKEDAIVSQKVESAVQKILG